MPSSEIYPIQEFLNYLAFQKRYSRHTIISYQNDLTGFFDFIALQYNSISLTEISASVVRSWLATLKADKTASKTINRKISSLKSFFKYQLKLNNIEFSPMTSVDSLKISRRLPSFIEQKDINTLFKYVDFPETWEGKTNYLLLMIFYQTGMRLSELTSLKESQVDKSNSSIKVLGKGNKERVIPVSNKLLKEIDHYIFEKRIFFKETANNYLFVGKKGKSIVSEICLQYCKKIPWSGFNQ